MNLFFEKYLLIHVLSFASHWSVVQASKWCRESRKIVKEAFPCFFQVRKSTNLNDNLERFCEEGNLKGVEYLFSKGVDVCKNKNRALFKACQMNQHQIAKFLISKGANPKNFTRFRTILRFAIFDKEFENVYLMISNGVFCYCADFLLFDGFVDSLGVEQLVKIFEPFGVKFNWKDNMYMLKACRIGNQKIVEFLVQQGNTWWRGLFSACRQGNIDVVDYLINKFNIQGICLKESLEAALKNGQAHVLSYFHNKFGIQDYAPNLGVWYLFCLYPEVEIFQKIQVREFIMTLTHEFNFVFLAYCKDGELESLKQLYKSEYQTIGNTKVISQKNFVDGIFFASKNGHLPVVEFLFEKIKCIHPYMQKLVVDSFPHMDIIKFLISKGIDLEECLPNIFVGVVRQIIHKDVEKVIHTFESFLKLVFSIYPNLDREKLFNPAFQLCFTYDSVEVILLMCFYGARLSEWWCMHNYPIKCIHIMRLFGYSPSKSDLQFIIANFDAQVSKWVRKYFLSWEKNFDTLDIYKRFKAFE